MNAEDRGVWWVLGCTAHIALRKDELPWLWGVLSGEILPLSAPAGIASAAESILAQGHSLRRQPIQWLLKTGVQRPASPGDA